jgi:hypothetical protein
LFAFQFYIDLLRLPVHLRRNVIFDEPGTVENDYVLIAETDLPHTAASAWDHRINDYILSHPEKFQMAERFPLPSGDVIQLYRVQ